MGFNIDLIICFLFISATAVLANDICAAGGPWEDLECSRLPNDTIPIHYDIYLNPDLTTGLFTGSVTIQITSTEPRDYFVVNIQDLSINVVSFNQIQDSVITPVEISNICEYLPNEFFIVESPSTIDAGDYELYFEFNGTLNGKIVGFYYSTYENENGEQVPLATTKFEPTYARQAFPSFDEPSFRATYTITIVRPSGDGYIGLSNMPVESEVADAPTVGQTEVIFETSVPMVTYLVCFIISDFVYIERDVHENETRLPFRVYGKSESTDDLYYALEFGSQTLLFYEGLFDYDFPLPKSDMAAIPDYSSGATEHWGIITFRETNILFNNITGSKANRQQVSEVIAHEMAHQWFGNLVTLAWWNDLWLNEGFAQYIQYIGVNNEHPNWDMSAQFVIDSIQSVFDLDSKLSSHAIVQDVCTADEINAMFDDISYYKGSSVIRMIEGFMGPDFQTGINNFIKDYAYKNAVTQDLWDELQAAWTNPDGATKDVSEIMDTWTKQMGYPMVTVQQVPGHPSQIRLFQTRFLKDPSSVSNNTDSPYEYKWNIPLSILTPSGKVVNSWLYTEDTELLLDLGEDVTWFKVNYNQNGYYRVNYIDSITWGLMGDLVSDLSLPTEDRASLYDDVFAFGDAGIIDYSITMEFIESLLNENEFVPWAAASKNLKKNIYLLLTTDVLGSFQNYTDFLATPMYRILGWNDGGDHLRGILRNVIADLTCMSGKSTCFTDAADLLESWIEDETVVLPLDTTRTIYWWGQIEAGNASNWNIMWERCLEELDPTARSNLYYGLSNSQDTDILNNYITMAQDENNVKSQDFLNILEYIALNPAGMDLVWDWVRTNWDWLVDRYTLNDRYLGSLIPDITQYFATQEKLDEMEQFFQDYPDAGTGALGREQAIDTVEYNIYWVAANSPVISAWLAAR